MPDQGHVGDFSEEEGGGAIDSSRPGTVVRLDEVGFREAVELFTMAFERDPAVLKICGDAPSKAARRAGTWTQETLRLHFRSGEPVYGLRVAGHLAAAAMVLTPGARYSPWSLAIWLWELAWRADPQTAFRALASLVKAHSVRPTEPHFWVGMVATHPEFEGLSCLRAMLDDVQRRSEAHSKSTGIFLVTENADSVRIFQHLGFDLAMEPHLRESTLFAFVRPNFSSPG